MTPIDVGLSASTSSGAGGGQIGALYVTGGGTNNGGLGNLLPKLSPDKAWIAYVGAAVVAGLALIGVALWLKGRR